MINEIKDETIIYNYAKISEYFQRKASGNDNSFQYLNEYIAQINTENLKKYIISQMKLYPEIANLERFEDMNRLKTFVTVSSIHSILNSLQHDELLRWYLNIKKKEIELDDTLNTISFDELSEVVYYKTQTQLRNEIIDVVRKYPKQFLSMEDVKKYADPTMIDEGNYRAYFEAFPSVVLNGWVDQLIKYEYNRTNSIRLQIDPYTLKKNNSVDEILLMLQLHNELYNISKFNNEIDFDEGLKLGDVYGNYAELAKAQTEQNLKKWVKLIAQFHRRITNVPNIIGGSLEYYQTKEEMVNSILTYITININYFKRVLNFDVIVGMTDLKIYIHYRELSELKSISKKLYQYYQIKMFRIRQYHEELLKMDFDEWSEKTTNENIFKLFIYKVLSIFPELNIRSVFDEVVSYTDFTKNVSIKNFTKYIIQYYLDKPEFIDITYKMIRYVNATFPTRSRRMIVPEETTNSTILQYLIQMFSESKILSNNWNFARFCLGFDYLLFGGVIPFINRLDNNKMKELFLKFDSLFPKEQLSKTYYNFDNLSHDQREAVIFNITSNHIEYREYSRIEIY